jgi:hypothetical protein
MDQAEEGGDGRTREAAGRGEGAVLAEGNWGSGSERGVDSAVLSAAADTEEPILLVAAGVAFQPARWYGDGESRPGVSFNTGNGGRTAAILTTFIASCKRLEINPFMYLRDVFDLISAHPMNRLQELLPDNWKAAQATTENLPA